MKTDVEFELLNIRQGLKESIDNILNRDVINLDLYKRIYVRWYVCNEMLRHYKMRYRKAV